MVLNSSISWPEGPVWFCSVVGSTGLLDDSTAFNASLQQCKRLVSGSSASLAAAQLLLFRFCFSNKQVLLCFMSWVEEDFAATDPWHPRTQEILRSFRTLHNEAERNSDLPRQRSHQVKSQTISTCSLWVRSKTLRGRGGIGIASNVVKVQGVTLATQGFSREHKARWCVANPFRLYVILGPSLRKHRDRNDSPISI